MAGRDSRNRSYTGCPGRILLNQNGINRLDARMIALEARVNALSMQLHDDILMLAGRDTDMAERLAGL